MATSSDPTPEHPGEAVDKNPPSLTRWLRFDKNEFAGSFGDLGTDLPLIAAMIPAAGLDAASVFIVFGAAQVFTGVVYGLPMPMQPLKAMAVLVIAQQLSGDVLYGAGIAEIGRASCRERVYPRV